MPYIKPEHRPELNAALAALVTSTELEMDPGHLNYVLTRLVLAWMGPVSYSRLALATGVLENVKQELYRRVAGPYEDKKRVQNGEVYPDYMTGDKS